MLRVEGRPGHAERRPGRGHGRRSPRTSAAGSSTARPASASRSTGSRWTTSPRSSRASRQRRADDLRRLRRHHPQRRRLHAGRHRPRRRSSTATPTAEAIHEYFLDNKLYSNLPRKYKISVTGCREDCARGLINDIALSGAIHEDGTARLQPPRRRRPLEQRRASRAGSTSSSRPRRRPRSSPAITAIFRDSEENRKPARQGAPEVPRRPRSAPRPSARSSCARVGRDAAPRRARGARPRAATTTSASRRRPTASTRAVGFCVPVGRLKATSCTSSCALAREYAHRRREVRLTHQQNVLLPWIPNEHVDALLAEPLAQELSAAARRCSSAALQTCTGKEFCGLAKVHTKDRARRDRRVPRRARAPERPRRGLPPALRGLLVELRAAPDRRRRHRGRAQEGRRRVRRGDGHPHRRPPRARPAVRRRRAQEGPALGPQRDAAADLQPLRDAPRRGRDVPRLRRPHRARVVDASSSTPEEVEAA